MKPRYRYNLKLKEWELIFRIDMDFIYIRADGHSVKLPSSMYDTYKKIVSKL